MAITGAQCRSARMLLSWSVSRLASATSITQCEIDDFELERRVPNTAKLGTIQRALEAAGMVFLSHDDVKMDRGLARSSVWQGDDGGLPAAKLPPSRYERNLRRIRRTARFPPTNQGALAAF